MFRWLFFGEALAKCKPDLKDGRTVTLQGAMMGIRHARSVSTVPYDLKFDRFTTMSAWADNLVPTMPPLVTVSTLMGRSRGTADVAVVIWTAVMCSHCKTRRPSYSSIG